MNIAIIGYGLEGAAAFDYWKDGNAITVCDRNEAVILPPAVKSQLGEQYLNDLNRFDLIIRSPHIHPNQIVKANSAYLLDKITSDTNEFMRVCPTKNIIGITGTKGKGTTSTLVSLLLNSTGKRVHLGGNIGVPALELLKQDIKQDDWVVLELSSFQLIDLRSSPHIALCLMIAPEHLDWHLDTDEYYRAKSQLFRHQQQTDMAIYYAENSSSQQIASASAGRHIPYYTDPGAFVHDSQIEIGGQSICRVSELKLLGQHNWQNVCAALTVVWQIEQNEEAFATILTSFSGLEHRLEFIRKLDSVKYYDDSFGTTPETAIVALQAFQEPKVIVLGGSDKGADYTRLAHEVNHSSIRKVLLIGEQAGRIEAALQQVGFTNYGAGGTSMTEIAWLARQAAQPGDVVLLSTACASFDMFRDYKDRGDQFKTAVQALL